ncbi:MAG: GNAT family N-acetyltransferase [Desulfobacterales bacterium]|nr:GNAT family N-acetyltransferase [Desulfobacterales bacterium]
MIRIIEAHTPEEFLEAKALFYEYADNLGIDLVFQNFSHEMQHLELIYSPPKGILLLAEENHAAIGCVALRPLDDATCEMKRLYVKPSARGEGIGRALCEKVIEKAKEYGYMRMRLDTLSSMITAQKIYSGLGFKEIEPYYENPIENTVYMELIL